MAQTTAPNELANKAEEYDVAASAHGGDGDGQRTVLVNDFDGEMSVDGIEALAEREGYFVFSAEPNEVTLVAYEDCAWKSRGA